MIYFQARESIEKNIELQTETTIKKNRKLSDKEDNKSDWLPWNKAS